jgi:protein-disulfide isomerase
MEADVGGAERAERRRRQRATQAASPDPTPSHDGLKRAGSAAGSGNVTRPAGAARGGSASARAKRGGPGRATASARASAARDDRRRILTAVAVVLLLGAAVLGGVLWQRSRSSLADAAPKSVDASYPARVDNGTVLAGADSAKATIDVYEDFLCPACGNFEQRDADKINNALVAGTLKVRYHIINLLDEQSNPAGYSLDSGAAALCAADAGAFPSYHASLYGNQPKEGGRGYSLDQLVKLGHDLGITDPAFDGCVRNRTHADAVRAQLAAATSDPALRRPRSGGSQVFGTPTVAVAGKVVDLGDSAWLDNALRAAAG